MAKEKELKTKKSAPKKSAPKKSAPKKSAPKKSAPKKSAPKKSAPKKSAPKKSAPKKSATKKSATKKSATKKSSVKVEYKYWAFISYSSKDRRVGKWLHKRLERFTFPKKFIGNKIFDGAVLGKNLKPIFRDRDELPGSAKLGDKINEALTQSRFLVVLCSKNSAKSKWVNREIETFKKLGREDRILAIILNGEPNATDSGKPKKECFPKALQYPMDPIAGDMRRKGDGKERGFLKVLAGITELGFDDLYNRNRRHKRMKTIWVIVLASLILWLTNSAMTNIAKLGMYNLQKIFSDMDYSEATKLSGKLKFFSLFDSDLRKQVSLIEERAEEGDVEIKSWPVDAYDTEIAFSPTGKQLISSNKSSITLWSIPKGKKLRTFNIENGSVIKWLKDRDSFYVLKNSGMNYEIEFYSSKSSKPYQSYKFDNMYPLPSVNYTYTSPDDYMLFSRINYNFDNGATTQDYFIYSINNNDLTPLEGEFNYITSYDLFIDRGVLILRSGLDNPDYILSTEDFTIQKLINKSDDTAYSYFYNNDRLLGIADRPFDINNPSPDQLGKLIKDFSNNGKVITLKGYKNIVAKDNTIYTSDSEHYNILKEYGLSVKPLDSNELSGQKILKERGLVIIPGNTAVVSSQDVGNILYKTVNGISNDMTPDFRYIAILTEEKEVHLYDNFKLKVSKDFVALPEGLDYEELSHNNIDVPSQYIKSNSTTYHSLSYKNGLTFQTFTLDKPFTKDNYRVFSNDKVDWHYVYPSEIEDNMTGEVIFYSNSQGSRVGSLPVELFKQFTSSENSRELLIKREGVWTVVSITDESVEYKKIDLESQFEYITTQTNLSAHDHFLQNYFYFIGDDRIVALDNSNSKLQIFNTKTGEYVKGITMNNILQGISYNGILGSSPDGKYLLLEYFGEIALISIETGEVTHLNSYDRVYINNRYLWLGDYIKIKKIQLKSRKIIKTYNYTTVSTENQTLDFNPGKSFFDVSTVNKEFGSSYNSYINDNRSPYSKLNKDMTGRFALKKGVKYELFDLKKGFTIADIPRNITWAYIDSSKRVVIYLLDNRLYIKEF